MIFVSIRSVKNRFDNGRKLLMFMSRLHLYPQDNQKKFQEMQVRLKEFAKLYDVIKNERNKCVNLIQTSTQKASEMREKIKILQNGMEILRTAVSQKER